MPAYKSLAIIKRTLAFWLATQDLENPVQPVQQAA